MNIKELIKLSSKPELYEKGSAFMTYEVAKAGIDHTGGSLISGSRSLTGTSAANCDSRVSEDIFNPVRARAPA